MCAIHRQKKRQNNQPRSRRKSIYTGLWRNELSGMALRHWRSNEAQLTDSTTKDIKNVAEWPTKNRIRFIFNLVVHVFIFVFFCKQLLLACSSCWCFFLCVLFPVGSFDFSLFEKDLKSCCDNWAKYKRFPHRSYPPFFFCSVAAPFLLSILFCVIALGSIEL